MNPARPPPPRAGRPVAPGEALVIFPDPNAYVSPSLGPAEAEHGRVVPTWNYVAAHVCGALRFADDPALLPRHLRELTARREAGREHPRAAGAAPAEYISQLERAVVGLEVAITRI